MADEETLDNNNEPFDTEEGEPLAKIRIKIEFPDGSDYKTIGYMGADGAVALTWLIEKRVQTSPELSEQFDRDKRDNEAGYGVFVLGEEGKIIG